MFNILCKVVLIGDSGVGKSSLMRQFVDQKFRPNIQFTIGVDFGSRVLQISDEFSTHTTHTTHTIASENKKDQKHTVKLQIWDTAGMERFQSISRSYLYGTSAILIVFDLTNRQTFKDINKHIDNCREYCSATTLLILIGNKCDLKSKRKVTLEEARLLTQKQCLNAYYETSAKYIETLDHMFTESVAKPVLRQLYEGTVFISDKSGRIHKNGLFMEHTPIQNEYPCCNI
jgi:small GTP-binding protein